MSSHNTLPRYVQISEMLIREIASGRLMEGERLPPEREMAGRMGIAVGTLRRALAVLTEKGLLERIHGSGNYIRHQADADSVYALFRLELPQGGGLPTANVLSVDRLPKPAAQPAYGTSREGHRIRRLRFLNHRPIAVEEIWLDGDRAAIIARRDLSDSLYHFYKTVLGLWITRAEDRVGMDILPGWTPPELGRPGAAAGHVERISWAQDGSSAEFSRTWFHAERARYV
ncbi:MAG: GntR family transcriptional regulator, partial [Pseudomonadota bacterium]